MELEMDVDTLPQNVLFDYVVELTLFFANPSGTRRARRRLSKHYLKLPESVRKEINLEVRKRFDEILQSLPKTGRIEDIS